MLFYNITINFCYYNNNWFSYCVTDINCTDSFFKMNFLMCETRIYFFKCVLFIKNIRLLTNASTRGRVEASAEVVENPGRKNPCRKKRSLISKPYRIHQSLLIFLPLSFHKYCMYVPWLISLRVTFVLLDCGFVSWRHKVVFHCLAHSHTDYYWWPRIFKNMEMLVKQVLCLCIVSKITCYETLDLFAISDVSSSYGPEIPVIFSNSTEFV